MNKEKGGLSCSDHQDTQYYFLNVSRNPGQKRLLCGECLYSEEREEWKQDFKDIMPLSIVDIKYKKVFRHPEKLIEKIKNDNESKFAKQFFQKSVQDLEKEFNKQIEKFSLLEQIYAQIKEQLKQQLKEFQEFQQQMRKIGQDFLDSIQFNQFIQLIASLREMEKQSKSDQYLQLNQKISGIIDDMMKNNNSILTTKIKDLEKTFQNLKMKISKLSYEKFQQQITELFNDHEKFIINQQSNVSMSQPIFSNFQSKLLRIWFLSELKEKLESAGKKIKSMDLIYLGSRDGLNSNSFWAKVNNKSQCLMVCQTKTNQFVYGGCFSGQWLVSVGYVADASQTSFLFSQNHNQIYPLKAGQNAIWFSGYIVYFGHNGDLVINGDFASVSSNLGDSYSIGQYQITQNHLFGGGQASIGECEVYEIIFL